MVSKAMFGATLWRYRNLLFIVVTALVFLPLPLVVEGQESKCGYVMLVMAIYWCTEALPLAVTAMIPLFLMPLLGLIPSDSVTILYMQESTMMFCGGLMVALAIEKCNLHKRIALGILMFVGVKPIWLMAGFIMPTWFLSMWISNTATTSMMLPILEAVLDKLEDIVIPKDSTDRKVLEGTDNIAMDNLEDSNWSLKEAKSESDRLPDKLPEPDRDNLPAPDYDDDGAGSSRSGPSSESSREKQNGDVPHIKFKSRPVSLTMDLKEPTGNSFNLAWVAPDGVDQEDSHSESSSDSDRVVTKEEKQFRDLCKGMTLAVAYSANIGGTATLTGTTPNIVMKDAADDLWQANGYPESPVNFASYMVFAAPTAAITVVFIWLWLVLFYMGPRAFKICGSVSEDIQKKEAQISASIKEEFKSLGKMHYDEWFVLLVFVSMVMLWFFRSPGFITGWGDTLHPGYIKDSVTSFLCTVALFVIPSQRLRWGSSKQRGKVENLLDWDTIHHKFPWSVIFLVGGGIALAESAELSGLSDMIGEALTVFDALPLWFMTFILALFTSFLTEVTSNTATCTLIMPIVATMAEAIGINPLYLMMPCAVSTSYAFMLPVATPPNAIAFSFNRVTVLDMVKAGIVLKLTIFVITLATETWGMSYFDFLVLPWAPTNGTNTTAFLREGLHQYRTLLD